MRFTILLFTVGQRHAWQRGILGRGRVKGAAPLCVKVLFFYRSNDAWVRLSAQIDVILSHTNKRVLIVDVQETYEYEQFSFITGNRDINLHNLNKIKSSLRKENRQQFRPILVNEKLEVIDGQHRLQAAKELGLPIFYEVQPDLRKSDIVLFQNQRRWGIEDYLKYHASDGNEMCKVVIALGLEIGMGSFSVLKILSKDGGNGRWRNILQSGEMGVYSEELEAIRGKIDTVVRLVFQIRDKLSMPNSGTFLDTYGFRIALYKFLLIEGVDEVRLSEKLDAKMDIFRKGVSSKQHFETIKQVYNFRCSKTVL